MDNLITGILAIVVFAAFTLGLAESISAAPFVIIVLIVVAMAGFDLWQSAREGLREERERKAGKE
jgi:uncharacterized membrane protein